MTIKQGLLAADLGLTEDDFHIHYGDLYVIVKPGVADWLKKNYPNVRPIYFTGQEGSPWAGRRCMDIPFGYMDEYIAEKKKARHVVETTAQ